jgi:MoxR-like ATPase
MTFPIFGGPDKGANHQHIPRNPPPWRRFDGGPLVNRSAPELSGRDRRKGETFQCDEDVQTKVSAALILRRPLLVTGSPGTGKSSLAYAIAYDLGLGAVLRWNITSRTILRDGLFSYDALDRLNEASVPGAKTPQVDEFIKLGPLGTALLPVERPRVLLVDELDKSDIDLPNDLLNIFEEGTFPIPELERARKGTASVLPYDAVGRADRVTIQGGRVACKAFPVVVLTSNEEREFSPPFLRRCVRLHLPDPTLLQLERIARVQLEQLSEAELTACLTTFTARSQEGIVATDQLMNALMVLAPDGPAGALEEQEKQTLRAALLEPVGRSRA